MHVLLIHQSFVSPHEPGGTRHYELARHMVERHHDFTIVASKLSYLTGQQTVSSTDLVTEQGLDGIRVLRASAFATLHRNFAWRVVSFLSFMVVSVVAALRAGRIDVVLGTSPPIFQGVSAWLVSRLRRCPFVLEVRDLWPEFAIDMGVLRNPLLITLSRWLERFLYRQAHHIVVNSPAYRTYLLDKGIPASKITLIANGVNVDDFRRPDTVADTAIRDRWHLGEKFVVTYTGALGLANDIDMILDAAATLESEPDIHFLLVGDGKERVRLEQRVQVEQLTNVTFTGSLPKAEIPDILHASNAGLATLQDIPMFRTTYPNKVFDYMAASLPTILAIDGVIREVVENAGGGIFVSPGNVAALAKAVHDLSQDPKKAKRLGAAAREYIVKHFDRHDQASYFTDLMQYLVDQVAATHQGSGRLSGWYARVGKRGFDLLLALPLIILLLPIFAVLGLFVRLNLGPGIWFQQWRTGLHGVPFTLTKFRTMTDVRDGQGTLLPDRDRLTSFGRFLRSTSMDELPELFHVVTGKMSLVGPRPLLVQYLERYSPEQARRHHVTPGMTGWAQVKGRNAMTWEEKFAYDVWYVDNMSFWLDIRILMLTVWKLVTREGINAPGEATMQEFQGSAQG